ncbi:Hypothetical predicted protein [Paramuricea clavata]|uniref:Uncharacterized protein n=1 Tax=Paramuricea clavata TaxID=317549 RepID=A0A7D9KZA4_PARCT|nr:Hypothetical predicted protein [Paramuricea clavata]
MYADDSIPHQAAETASLISRNLQDLLNVENWVDKSRLVLNEEKSKSILIGSRQKLKKEEPLILTIKDKSINQLSSVKLLGVHADETLRCKPHCESLLKNCSRSLGLLYRF